MSIDSIYLLICYMCMYVSLYAYNVYREKKLFSLSLISFLTIYQIIVTICCLFFYIFADGLIRYYSRITFPPFFYLFFGFFIALIPFYLYERSNRILIISKRQIAILDFISILIAFCGILPFLETIVHLPEVFSGSDSLAKLYEQQLLHGEKQNYMSFLGRKFYYVLDIFEYFIPGLFFVQLWKKKTNPKIIFGLAICILTVWLRSTAMAGRSSLIGNALYVLGVYLVFRRFFSKKIREKIARFGIIAFAILISGLMVVSISRFVSNNSSNYDNVFQWMSLYAGEGPINFNNDMWYTKDITGGYCTFPLLKSVEKGHMITVPEVWNATGRLGVEGNHYYTWIGMFYADWGRIGGMIIIIILAFIFGLPFRTSKPIVGVSSLFFLGLWVKVLLMGPMFFALAGSSQQIYLGLLLLFCFILNNYK